MAALLACQRFSLLPCFCCGDRLTTVGVLAKFNKLSSIRYVFHEAIMKKFISIGLVFFATVVVAGSAAAQSTFAVTTYHYDTHANWLE